MEISIIITLISFLIFFLYYKKEPRRIVNGLLFNIFLFFALISLALISYTVPHLQIILVLMMIIFLFVAIFGIVILIAFCLLNARVVMKKESKKLQNLLTLFLGVGLLVYLILRAFLPHKMLGLNVGMIATWIDMILVFYFFSVFNFLSISLLYSFNKAKPNQDFIVVLGSRLIGDRVPPLLSSRIDKAIEIYKRQETVTTPPKIIFSGGQGSDELIPEALGMQRYAITKGIPIENTILEDKSVSTYENMKFSKDIMDSDSTNGDYNSVFVTNNYHLFRASLFAKKAGLKSQGIGSKTALYFLPNAFIREYIAIASMNKKKHIIVISCVVGFSIAVSILDMILKNFM